MTYIDRYRNKVASNQSVQMEDFIAISPSKTELIILPEGVEIDAVVTVSDKEGPDEYTIHSYAEDGLEIGQYVQYNDDYLLIYEKVTNPRREGFIHTFKALQCNVEFEYNSQNIRAYYKGSLRQFIKESDFTPKVGVDIDTNALLIYAATYNIPLSARIIIGNREFRQLDFDEISISGVKFATIEKALSTIKAKEVTAETSDYLVSGMVYTFPTEDGYFSSSPKVKLLSRIHNEVKFEVPFDINSVEITTKENENLLTDIYEVRRG